MKEFPIPQKTVSGEFHHKHIEALNKDWINSGKPLPYVGRQVVNQDTGESLNTYDIKEKTKTSGRMSGAWTKEPWTVQWLRDTLKPEHVFWDIGACVGVYTVMTEKLLGCKEVHAFEPVPQNYCELTDHIALNDCVNAHAYHVAITDEVGFTDWSFQPTGGEGCSGEGGSFGGAQMCKIHNVTMDHLVFELGFTQPDIIKVDTDGTPNDRIVNGGLRTLENVTSILIEIFGEPWDLEFHKKLLDLGFELDMEYYEGIRSARQKRKIPILRECVELIYRK